MLPYSRNTTYSTNTPVKSNDLNAIQDNIVGNLHGVMKVIIPAAAFSSSALDGTGFIFGGYKWEWSSDSRYIYAPLKLSSGTVISTAEWRIDKAGHSFDLECSLVASKDGVLDSGAGFSSVDATSGFGYHNFSQAWNKTILDDGTSYHIRAGVGIVGAVSGLSVESCLLTFSRPSV